MRRTDGFAYGEPTARERWYAFVARLVAIAGPLAAMVGRDDGGGAPHVMVSLVVAEVVALLIAASILGSQYRASEEPAYGLLALAFGYAGVLAIATVVGSGEIVPLPRMLAMSSVAGLWLWIAWHLGFLALAAAYVWGERIARTRPDGADRARRLYERLRLTLPVVVSTVLLLIAVGSHAFPRVLGTGDPAPLQIATICGLGVFAIGLLTALVRTTHLRQSTNLWLAVVLTSIAAQLLACAIDCRPFGRGAYVMLLESAGADVVFLMVLLDHVNEQLVRATRTNRELVGESIRDPLTELYNKRGFDERLAEAIRFCRRTVEPLSVIVIDVDHFKTYNDFYGRAAGDRALRSIAAAIAATALRPLDSGSRVGGNEFALLLPATDASGALAVAIRVRDHVRRYAIAQPPDSGLGVLTISLGVACAGTARGLDGERLLARASGALYEAKHNGRDRVHIADTDETELPPRLRVVT